MSIRDEISRIEQAKSDIKSAIIEKGVEVPDSAKINEYAEQISRIPTGTNVQRYEGTFTTDTNGEAIVDCGFSPDVVTFILGVNINNCEINVSIDFSSKKTTKKDVLAAWTQNDEGVDSFENLPRTSTGFYVKCCHYSDNWGYSRNANKTYEFVAIKFT